MASGIFSEGRAAFEEGEWLCELDCLALKNSVTLEQFRLNKFREC